MLKNLFFTAFFTLLCFSFLSAQTSKKSADTNWEILLIYGLENRQTVSGVSYEIRTYNYLTSGAEFNGPVSLEWIKDSGWELVSSDPVLYFKRRYNTQRTEKEIEWLKKEYEKNRSPIKPVSQNDLIDLDLVEYKQKSIDLGKSEKAKYENLLNQINEFPIKVISVETTSYDPKFSRVKAEIVLDATNVLVKDGKSYRSSEAEKYFQETSKKILEKLGLRIPSYISGLSWNISQGEVIPQKIGDFNRPVYGICLKISLILNLNNRQIIVSQGFIDTRVEKDKQ